MGSRPPVGSAGGTAAAAAVVLGRIGSLELGLEVVDKHPAVVVAPAWSRCLAVPRDPVVAGLAVGTLDIEAYHRRLGSMSSRAFATFANPEIG